MKYDENDDLDPETVRRVMSRMPEDEPEEEAEQEPDEDAEAKDAALRSAMTDFLSAIGVSSKRVDKAVEAFKDLLDHCSE